MWRRMIKTAHFLRIHVKVLTRSSNCENKYEKSRSSVSNLLLMRWSVDAPSQLLIAVKAGKCMRAASGRRETRHNNNGIRPTVYSMFPMEESRIIMTTLVQAVGIYYMSGDRRVGIIGVKRCDNWQWKITRFRRISDDVFSNFGYIGQFLPKIIIIEYQLRPKDERFKFLIIDHLK